MSDKKIHLNFTEKISPPNLCKLRLDPKASDLESVEQSRIMTFC